MDVGVYFFDFISKISSELSNLSTGETIILDIALILIISAMIALIAKILRQPLIPAYVLSGFIIGPLIFGFIKNTDLISAFSEIGIAFLLFTAGLEISFRKIKEANMKKILLIGLLQMGIVFGISFFLAGFLNLTTIQATYLGIILAFSSTMVDVKLLADSGKIVTLSGRIVLGILLLQDFAAIISIVLFTSSGFAVSSVSMAFVKLFALIIFAMVLQKAVLNRIFKFAARSTELLFLSSLAVLFLFIIISYISKLSIVIGAFIAGVSLANSPFKTELESRIAPLRDFFAILFFVMLGMQITFSGINQHLPLFLGLLAGGLLLKPFVTLILLRIMGYTPKASFLTAISLAQLSEFSFIIGMIGVSFGVFDQPIFSTVILATITTMSFTPYFINSGNRIYEVFKHPLSIFKRIPVRERLEYSSAGDAEVLLVGAHRMGSVILKHLLKKKENILVIDYNPEIINALIKKKVPCIYGEISGPEIISKVNFKKIKTVISTIPSYDENLYLLTTIKKINPKIKIIVTGSRISETLSLYSEGADYVITPKILAGEELKRILNSRKTILKKAKKRHLKELNSLHNLLY